MTVMDAVSAWFAAEDRRFAAELPRLVFPRAEYSARLARLRGGMAAAGLDLLVLTAPDAMCWLTGYDSRWYRSHSGTRMPPSQCVLVPVDDREPLVHIETAAHAELVRVTSCVDEFMPVPGSAFDHEPTLGEFTSSVADQALRRRWLPGVVGVERWSSVPNPATLSAVETALTDRGATVRDATTPIRSARRLKSAAEIGLIEQAQHACDAGIRLVVQRLRPGMTELQAWATYVEGIVAAGGEPTAMHETIATGPMMPFAHMASSRRPVHAGEYVHADVAAAVHRYHARATRTIFLGDVPAPLTTASVVLAEAHDVFLAEARVGRTFGDLNRALTAFFDANAVEGWAGGYELGVSFPPDWVGEFSWTSVEHDCPDLIEDGLVTNVELFVSGLAMIDTAVFTTAGPRLLSSLPRTVLRAQS